jgi:class 3 adenylate cyclase
MAHAGVHARPLIDRDGDFYSRTVNVASRIAGRAQAGEVLASDAVRGSGPGSPVRAARAGPRSRGPTAPVTLFRVALEPD